MRIENVSTKPKFSPPLKEIELFTPRSKYHESQRSWCLSTSTSASTCTATISSKPLHIISATLLGVGQLALNYNMKYQHWTPTTNYYQSPSCCMLGYLSYETNWVLQTSPIWSSGFSPSFARFFEFPSFHQSSMTTFSFYEHKSRPLVPVAGRALCGTDMLDEFCRFEHRITETTGSCKMSTHKIMRSDIHGQRRLVLNSRRHAIK